MTLKKKRVTILGGGPSALSCAYQLTKTPELAARHEVTVYQMGWRLGGKGASGRNRRLGDRIEEHGLHILFGFYQNFFEMMWDAYAAIERPVGAPLATFREAFHPHSFGVVEASENDVWNSWFLQFPRNCEVPGVGVAINSGLDYLSMALQAAIGAVFGWQRLAKAQACVFPEGTSWERSQARGSTSAHLGARAAIVVLQWGLGIVSDALHVVMAEAPALARALARTRECLIAFMLEHSEDHPDLNRSVLLLDFALSSAIGILVDRVFTPQGCDGIDGEDFRAWLARHGAAKATLASPFARAIYDAAFSFKRGAAFEESMSAGVAIRTMARMGATYKGAMYYKMQAGMGDTVFGPLYLTLRARGVRFAFFHKASALHVAKDGKRIESVDLEQQVDLECGDPFGYEPLYDVRGLPCWPSEPLGEQIRDYEAVANIDLESYYSGYKGKRICHLEAGRHFDQLVYAMPVQTVPFVAPELMRVDARWQRMVDHVMAVQTQSLQVWFDRTLPELGWPQPQPLLSVYTDPLNTWSDMSQTLPRENFGGKDVSYFTGAQPGPDLPPLPEHEPHFEEEMRRRAKRDSLHFLRHDLTRLLPKAADAARPEQVDWALLHDPEERHGVARFDAQYFRSNCGPTERCTLALPGTAKYRLRAGDTGFHNLAIAGDWIDNHFHVACMEGAVMGGIYAARAVSGIPFPIIGEELDDGRARP
ncbi:MAG TPA: NAD(P)-binding protein [Polyangiaceae bacterium]|nr:NAD(P)-binding protein [Polyangiaceae bacterium]